MGTGKKKKCRHCKRLFIPDARNRDRQKYCYRSECRKESKRASQRRWLKKPENRDHFSGPVNGILEKEQNCVTRFLRSATLCLY
jgi:hypothetical protein